MANGIRTGEPRGFNKGRSSKFHAGSRVRQTPEEGRRTYQPKRCGNNNKDEDNSPKTFNDKNQQASSQKFRQQILFGSLLLLLLYQNIYLKQKTYTYQVFLQDIMECSGSEQQKSRVPLERIFFSSSYCVCVCVCPRYDFKLFPMERLEFWRYGKYRGCFHWVTL